MKKNCNSAVGRYSNFRSVDPSKSADPPSYSSQPHVLGILSLALSLMLRSADHHRDPVPHDLSLSSSAAYTHGREATSKVCTKGNSSEERSSCAGYARSKLYTCIYSCNYYNCTTFIILLTCIFHPLSFPLFCCPLYTAAGARTL